VGDAARGDARAAGRARRDGGELGRGAVGRVDRAGGDGIPARIAAGRAALAARAGAVALAAIVALSAWLSAPRAAVAVPALAGVALLALRRAPALAIAAVALAVAVGAALHEGAAPGAAPLWGAGLLAAAALAERALLLGGDGEVEAGALIAWLAGVGTLVAGGLAAGALVLVAAQTGTRAAAAGLAGAALLAVLPAALARRRAARGRERGDAR
jgi:hypothetical protein